MLAARALPNVTTGKSAWVKKLALGIGMKPKMKGGEAPHVATGRSTQLEGEEPLQEWAQDQARQRNADDRQECAAVVEPGIVLQSRHDAQWDANDQGHGERHQSQLQ